MDYNCENLNHAVFENGKLVNTIPFSEQEKHDYLKRIKDNSLHQLRQKRDELLKESDILVLSDRWESYSVEKKAIITNYRQELRDIPSKYNIFEDVIWPKLQ